MGRGTDWSTEAAIAEDIGVVRPLGKLLFLRVYVLCDILDRVQSVTADDCVYDIVEETIATYTFCLILQFAFPKAL